MRIDVKKTFGIGLTVITLIGSTIFFPAFSNKDLSQATISYKVVGACVALIALGILAIINKLVHKKSHSIIFNSIGILFLTGFLLFLFIFYLPFVNQKVLNMKDSCGGVFIRGDVVNLKMLRDGNTAEYDSLSKFDPKRFIEMTNCDPSKGWTFESIENNLKGVVYRYILTVFFASTGLIAIAISVGITKNNH